MDYERCQVSGKLMTHNRSSRGATEVATEEPEEIYGWHWATAQNNSLFFNVGYFRCFSIFSIWNNDDNKKECFDIKKSALMLLASWRSCWWHCNFISCDICTSANAIFGSYEIIYCLVHSSLDIILREINSSKNGKFFGVLCEWTSGIDNRLYCTVLREEGSWSSITKDKKNIVAPHTHTHSSIK